MKPFHILGVVAVSLCLAGCQTTGVPGDRRATLKEINETEARCHVIDDQMRELKMHREKYKNDAAEFEPEEQKWREAFDTRIRMMMSECRMSAGSIGR